MGNSSSAVESVQQIHNQAVMHTWLLCRPYTWLLISRRRGSITWWRTKTLNKLTSMCNSSPVKEGYVVLYSVDDMSTSVNANICSSTMNSMSRMPRPVTCSLTDLHTRRHVNQHIYSNNLVVTTPWYLRLQINSNSIVIAKVNNNVYIYPMLWQTGVDGSIHRVIVVGIHSTIDGGTNCTLVGAIHCILVCGIHCIIIGGIQRDIIVCGTVADCWWNIV